jgi:hypothetical protein
MAAKTCHTNKSRSNTLEMLKEILAIIPFSRTFRFNGGALRRPMEPVVS